VGSIRNGSIDIDSRPVTRHGLAAWLALVVLLLGTATPLAAQDPDPRALEPARAALEEGRRLGKLDSQAFDRLLRQFGGRAQIRVLIGLETAGEPFARLKGRQIRSRAARLARRAAIARLQNRLIDRPDMRAMRWGERFRHIPYLALEVDAEQLARLARRPEVASIRADAMFRPVLHDTAPQVGADVAWLYGYTGAGQVIAILDGGFDTGHSAFAGRVVDEACYSTTSGVDNTTTLCPDGNNPGGADSQVGPGAAMYCDDMFGCDHGTHVAGIAAGDDIVYRGIAPGADILPIQVFSRLHDLFACGFQPPCLSAHTSDIIRGLARVYELRDTHEMAVVNMSIGGEAYATEADCDAAYPALKAAIDNLHAAGITTVVASGNEYHTEALAAPACLSSAVSVGAVDVIDNVADFSNSADFLDVLSGGVGIVSAVPGGGFADKTGTSMASPGMAGAVAVLRSADPQATPDEIVDAIKTTGVPVTDWRNGRVTPRIQVDAAVDLLTDGNLDRIALALVSELEGLDEPVGVTHAGDGSGRLFIMQRGGRVLVRDGGALLATPFIDVSANVACCAADGLLGLAFHPEHASNGRVFVSYLAPTGEIIVEGYTLSADPNQVDAGSAEEIIRIAATLDGHHGGRLHFGPDDYLYIATGDGAEDGSVPMPGPSGDAASLLGKILRIDVDASGVAYAVPPDNPFVGDPGAFGEIWALGLRDPRRFAFDALSGELYVADVGESEAHEINVQAADSTGGEDYGWNVMEGSACRAGQACDPTGLFLPIAEYGFGEGCAVTGGVVYRGATHEDLYGAYLFGDLCSGRIWGLRSADGVWQQEQMTQAAVQVSAFGSDESGEAYLVDQAAGRIYRLEVSDLLIDTLTLPPAYIGVPYSKTVSAAGGAPPYEWSIVAGALPVGFSLDAVTGTITGTAATVGSSDLTVQVRDAEFATVSRNLRLNITPPPLAIENGELPLTTIDRPFAVTLTASGGTPPYTWSTAGALPAGITLDAGGTLSGTASEQGEFSFTAIVTDSVGEQQSEGMNLLVLGATVPLTLNVTDSNEYGNDYGTDQHLVGLLATFTGTSDELSFHLTGYDIDYVDELSVSLNGNLLGYLTVGPNNGLNAGDVFVIPPAAQLAGENQLVLKNRQSGFIWGATDLLISDQSLPLAVATTALPDATFAAPYAASLEANGGKPPYAWSMTAGELPSGLTLSADGTLSGTPLVQGVFAFTARVTDELDAFVEQPLMLRSVGASGTVEVILELATSDDGQYGNNYGSNEHESVLYAVFDDTGTDVTLYVTGYDIDDPDEVAVYLNDNLLGYLSVGPNNGLNAGDQFAIAAGEQQAQNLLRFQERVSGWTWGVTDLLLSDQPPPPAIDTTALPDATFGESYSASLSASGGTPPYTWSLAAGSLPAGLTLAADGTVSGTPLEQGTFAFTARVTDDLGAFAEQSLTLDSSGSVEVVLAIGVADGGQYGHNYGTNAHPTDLYATFTSSGTDLILHVTGYDIDFVDELAVDLNGELLGHLTVGPNNALNAGDTFIIPAGEQASGVNLLHFSVKVSGWTWGVTDLLLTDAVTPLEITTTALPDASIGEAYTASLEASGGQPPYTWSLAMGDLPAGITLAADGALSGTPGELGDFDFTARVTDDAGSVAEQGFTLRSLGTGGTLPVNLEVGVPDTGQYGHNYGTSEYPTELFATFAGSGTDLELHVTGYDIDFVDELAVHLNGDLLGYLSVGPNNGLNAGDTFIIPAGEQDPDTNLLRFSVKTAGWIWGVTDLLLIEPPLGIGTTALPDATYDRPYAATLAATGGRPPYTWTLTAGTLPGGVALAADGSISGTPAEQGVFAFTARVTDDAGAMVEQDFTLRAVGASGTVEVILEIGVADTGQYGHNYGTSQHPTDLYASFMDTGTDLELSVTGYDIDFVDELAVYLNGSLLGHLSVGPNNGLNAGDTFDIPAGAQQPGANELRFSVKTAGWIWGVTDLLLSDPASGPLTITTTSLPDATYLVSYAATLEAFGGQSPYTWSLVSGELPDGVSLAADGSVSGTPAEQGVFAFTARVTDDAGAFVEQDFTLRAVGASGTVEVILEIGVADTGQYGHNYGASQHPTELYATFMGTGTDLVLGVTGYDIDFVDELAVYLNDELLGHLTVGPNNGINAGDTFAIPADAQQAGVNLLRFEVKTAGWTWGVTDLLIAP